MHQRDKQIIHLAIPAVITNVTVPLLGLVDLTIVGHMGNEKYIGAVAIGSMLMNVLYWLMGFLRMGTSGLTAQSYGAENKTECRLMLFRSLLLASAIGLALLLLQTPIRLAALALMKPPTETAPLVSTYFNICIWGAPAMLCIYAATGWFVGMQDTRAVMIVSISQNVINIIASLLFVYALGMKIEGVACGTLLAQWLGFFIAVVLMKRHQRGLPRANNTRQALFSHSAFGKLLNVDRDFFLRTLFLVGVNLFFTAAGSWQGNIILSANTLLLTFMHLFSYIMDGFAFAGEALCGRAAGAGDRLAFTETVSRLFRIGAYVTLIFSVTYLLLGMPFLHLITNEQTVLDAARQYLFWVVLIPVAGVAAFIYDGIFVGLTLSRGMMYASLFALITFLIVWYAASPFIGNHALWMAFIVYLATRGIVQYFYFKNRPLNEFFS